MHSRLSVWSFRKSALILTASVTLISLAAAADKKGSIDGGIPVSSSGLRVPVVSFIAQDPMQLRPVIGGVGAAVFGDPLPLGDSVTRIYVSPAGSFAIAEGPDDQPLSVLPLGADGAGALQLITGAFPHSDRVEFSVSGSTAVLYSASRQRIQIIGNLTGAPVLKQEFDVTSLTMPLISLAVSDDASLVLVGVSDGQGGAVYRLTADNAMDQILSTASPAALRLVPQGDSALLADNQLNQILLISTLSGTPASRQLAGADDGANGPNLIELLAGNRTAVIANANSNSLLLIDLQLGKATSVPIFGPAISLKPVKMRTGVALSTSPSGYWLLGGEPGNPMVTMIADPAPLANQ